jgi:hypothetical protein
MRVIRDSVSIAALTSIHRPEVSSARTIWTGGRRRRVCRGACARPPSSRVERHKRPVVGVRRADDGRGEAMVSVSVDEHVLAPDLVARVLPEEVAQRRRLRDRQASGRALVCRRGTDEDIPAGTTAEQLEVGAHVLRHGHDPFGHGVELQVPQRLARRRRGPARRRGGPRLPRAAADRYCCRG